MCNASFCYDLVIDKLKNFLTTILPEGVIYRSEIIEYPYSFQYDVPVTPYDGQ